MNVLIIEDDSFAAEKLSKLINKIDCNINIMSVLSSVEQSINWLSGNPVDLIFMDIELDDGVCFEIFESIDVKTPVAFTTAYDEYAIKAFKVNSIDYLLKPINKKSLERAIKKYKTYHHNDSSGEIKKLIYELTKEYKTRFLVKIGDRFKSLPTNEINCFYIKNRITFLRSNSGRNFSTDYSLEQLEKLIDPTTFFRINRNYILHIDSITDIYSFSNSRLLVKIENKKDDDDLIVSREKVKDFKKWIDK